MSQSKPVLNLVEPIINAVMGVKNPPSIDESNNPKQALETNAVFTYLGGTIIQITVMVLALWGMEQVLTQMKRLQVAWLPMAIAVMFFTLLSIRSRIFSPLDNTRSKARYNQVARPAWAPPPIAFPIIWMTIGVLRVISSVLVWLAMGQEFLTLPLITFVIHLALGDTWNTIFTVEGKYGLAVPVVIIGPWLSAIAVTVLYGQTTPLAGWLLMPSVVWITVACLLVYSIWRLNDCDSNKDPETV